MLKTIFVCVSVLLGVCVSRTTASFDFQPNSELVNNMLKMYGSTPFDGQESIPEIRKQVLTAVLRWGRQFLTQPNNIQRTSELLSKHFDSPPTPEEVVAKVEYLTHPERSAEEVMVGGNANLGDDHHSWFGFIPPVLTSVIPGEAAVVTSDACWKTLTLATTPSSDGSVKITISAAGRKEFLCESHFMLGTVEQLKIGVKVDKEGDMVETWTPTKTRSKAESWDLATNGIRFMRFDSDEVETVLQIIDTALLFSPELFNPVPSGATKRNLEFMKYYANVDMQPRSTSVVSIDPDTVQSGDFFGIIRLDGLDPMLGWAMGSTTGHTTVAIRENGKLYVAESTAKDDYWPVNGIQRTPFDEWVARAVNASMQVVHAPLAKQYADAFNATAANAFFRTVEGVNYGYYNMLWGWVDTLTQNYPCVPPYPSKKCLEWEHMIVLFGVLGKAIPGTDMIWLEAWNKRAGTVGKSTAEALMVYGMAHDNITDTLPTVVESDEWRYNTTRYGKPAVAKSMVCCVFVCNMWKHAGVFGDMPFNCAELTNWDDYALTILEAHPERPEQCKQADPDNALCQLVGDYTLTLNQLGTKDPYAHMAEKCGAMAPAYQGHLANC